VVLPDPARFTGLARQSNLLQNVPREETSSPPFVFVLSHNVMPTEFRERLKRLRHRMSETGAAAVVVTHLSNVRYLAGFTGSAGILIVESSRAILFTDGRYAAQAPQQVKPAGVRVIIPQISILKAAGEHIASSASGRRKVEIAFDPANLTVAQHKVFRRSAKSRISWLDASGWVEDLRLIKSNQELVKMRAAARLISKVFDEVVPLIRPGITELDLAAEIDYSMRKLGASGPSFETIVASGPRAALPHASPTAKRLRRNELVVLDAGAILADYCSDMTRTVFVGKASSRVKSWYRAVLDAQSAATAAVMPGAESGAPDAAARAALADVRLDQHFIHSTGHGLGLEVHEAPRLAKGQKTKLQAGMIVTIEPGIYVEGVGGIRIEDDVAIHAGRNEILTTATRELLEL
jgi:Xaa-Pro aminopeptidase